MLHRRNPGEKLTSKIWNIWLKISSVVPHGTISSAVWCGHQNNLVIDRSARRNMNGIWLVSLHSVWMTLQEPYANLHIFSYSTSISLLWCSLCTFNEWVHRFSTRLYWYNVGKCINNVTWTQIYPLFYCIDNQVVVVLINTIFPSCVCSIDVYGVIFKFFLYFVANSELLGM